MDLVSYCRQMFRFSFLAFFLSRGVLGSKEDSFVFVILNQPHELHSARAHILAENIAEQARETFLRYHVHVAELDWPSLPAWTYYPIIEKMHHMHGKNCTWIIILEEWSQIRLKKLQQLLAEYDSTKAVFLGNGVHDATETIIHHFDTVDKNHPFLFPDIRAGLVLSTALVLRLAERWSDISQRPKVDFSIDAPYEFARFVQSVGITLTHHDDFCIEDMDSCAVVYNPGNECEASTLKRENIHFAVKTCEKFHEERLPILRKTWLQDTPNYALYSDVQDPVAGTVSLGVPNTERGHCGKTMAIIRHVAKLTSVLWLAVVDDDTLLSAPRLKSLLSCYDPKDLIAIGERYGFHTLGQYGYEYITGGGGMIFSRTLVERLAKPEVCECPSNDTPDDMYLGVCLKRLSVPVIHSEAFHQSRPMDYPEQLLRPELPVSFHKYWMVDPLEIYSRWLSVNHTLHQKDEL